MLLPLLRTSIRIGLSDIQSSAELPPASPNLLTIKHLTRLMNELPGIDRKHHKAIVGLAIRSRDR